MDAYGYDLLVVGSANADLVIPVGRRPGPGETVLGGDVATHPGGKGANQAVAAARLGARTALLARVGDDAHGRLLLDAQRAAGVDTTAVRVGGAPTGVALITVDPAGDNSIVVSPGANAHLRPEDVRASAGLVARSRVVSTQLEIPLDTVAELAAAVGAGGGRLVLNLSPPAALPAHVLAVCDPLIVNEHEARYLLADAPEARSGDPAALAEALLALGPRSVVVTLGADGAQVADRTGGAHVPAVAVRAVDTTGAGDAFTAALAWRLAEGEALTGAAHHAARVAAVSVTRHGAQDSYPSRQDLSDEQRRRGGA